MAIGKEQTRPDEQEGTAGSSQHQRESGASGRKIQSGEKGEAS